MKSKLLLVVFMLVFQAACMAIRLPALFGPTQAPAESAPATPTLPPPPGVTPAPSETPLSPPRLFQQVTLTEETYSESGESPVYTLETTTPVLAGSDDPRVLKFNRQAEAVVAELVAAFKSGFEYLSDSPVSAGSFYQVTFIQLAPPGDILSIQFGVDGYADGAAHPYHLTRTLNFNLETGQVLSLGMLFAPQVDYLTLIADICKAELSTREIGFEAGFTGGADPLPENYQNWNLTYEGLLITFDEYQVAAYAAGMQQVLLPFSVLREYFSADFKNQLP
ncbi:MAG: RsiV family protein [Anaerolineales bacterium]|jgi:hypothetical protein|nr:RsiV family protein [Anaerolineales bacterium]